MHKGLILKNSKTYDIRLGIDICPEPMGKSFWTTLYMRTPSYFKARVLDINPLWVARNNHLVAYYALLGTEVRSPWVQSIIDSTISSQSEIIFVVMFFFSKPDSSKAIIFRRLVAFAIN